MSAASPTPSPTVLCGRLGCPPPHAWMWFGWSAFEGSASAVGGGDLLACAGLVARCANGSEVGWLVVGV